MATPKNLTGLYDNIVEAAKSFGFDGKNGKLRKCLDKSQVDNYWFGFIREDQNDSGPYNGLSFVIFPERESEEEENGSENKKHHHCLAAICIGSSNLGADSELARSPMFRRSFYSLTKRVLSEQLFFKSQFDEISQPTPLLRNYLEKGHKDENENDFLFEEAMIATTAKYNTGEYGGLLPAAMIVDYTKEDEYKLICSWLAQYAEWRNWASSKKGYDKYNGKNRRAIDDAIKEGRNDLKCPTVEDVKEILDDRHFIVLQGAPGCGKTWTAKQIASKYFQDKTKFIQFHAETTYADFVYGIKPVLNREKVAYEGNKGILLEILDLAINDPNNDYLLIIDEFNRANLANVLGPVFYLFEQNSGGNNLKLKLGKWHNPADKDKKEEKENEDELVYDHIPKNLYVIATMNTADKSLAVVDFALRRRFSWVTLRPHKLGLPNFDEDLFDKINLLFMKYATDEELNLQPGQSYFMDINNRKDSILYGLMPLMKEYFNGGYLLPARDEFIQLFYNETGIFMYE